MSHHSPFPNNFLFSHQEEAFQSLLATARAFFSRSWRRLPICPRFVRLLAGPTGSGKTYLIRRLARELSIPILELSATGWLPIGVSNRGGKPTWPQIADFCRVHRRGIVFADEVDKLHGTTDWMTSIRVEMFSLLDQRLLGFVKTGTPQSERTDFK